ncbi:carbohydrate kinase family protein [Jatrophihabitans endophyticus]|uniref:carbohydrate kinase family protein n=1 Tax=Jatrophihabitans endophyticus TaxID=1206085 RepID=UPI0019F859B9|nr:carbohydrate kinase family protein [Jatrophihabitans endophyticus]MBE7187403.1 carbohydrate kinase family protein [Jatrophihabitans endophyticus]
MHVVCVGDLMVDVLAELPGPLAVGSDTPAPVTTAGGGAAANVAAWLVAAGVESTFVGRAGDDAFGRFAVDELRAAGVRTSVVIDTERPTGTCVVLVDPEGERTMIPSSGANGGPVDVEAVLPASADLLYLSGYTLLGAASRPFGADVLALARRRGWPVAVDAASAAPLASMPDFLDAVGHDVLLFANTDEAVVLTGLDEAAAAAQSLALRCGRAVVKRGAAGAVWSDGSGVWTAPAVPVEAAERVDSTGAGDAFAAGFLAASLSGDAPGDSLRGGAALAARALRRVGARPGRG